MNDVQTLERRYRRWLVCYPRAFRREHEAELLTVLLAISRAGQRHAAIGEVLALLRSAVGMRLRPDLPRSARALRTAVGLLCLCAVLELVTWGVMVGTIGGVAARLAATEPGVSEGVVRASVVGHLLPDLVAAPFVAVLWLMLAWANGHGRRWGRTVLVALVVTTTVGAMSGLTASGRYAMVDVVAGLVLWLTALIALVLTLHNASEPYYRPTRAQVRSR